MRTKAIVSLLCCATLAGCDSTTGPAPPPTPPSIRDWRVIAVRGDQTTPVTHLPPASSFRSAATVGADGFTTEPLVARIELTAEAKAAGMSLESLPPNSLVHWYVPPEAGRLYAATTTPDDSAYVINRYAPGTRAGTWTATAGRLIDGEIVTDATWQLVVLPGPPAVLDVPDSPMILWLGDTLDLASLVSAADQYGNPIPADSIHWDPAGPTYTSDVERWDTLTVTAGELERSIKVVWLRQLGPGWTHTLHCVDGRVAGINVDVDSLIWTITLDSIRVPFQGYPPPSTPYPLEGAMYGHSDLRYYRRGSTIREGTSDPRWWDRYFQRPGALRPNHSYNIDWEWDEEAGAYVTTDPGVCRGAKLVRADFRAPTS